MFEATAGSVGPCWICDGRMRRSGERPGPALRRRVSARRQRAFLEEFVCSSCGMKEVIWRNGDIDQPFAGVMARPPLRARLEEAWG